MIIVAALAYVGWLFEYGNIGGVCDYKKVKFTNQYPEGLRAY